MKVYLAGPMRGYPAFNFPAFHAAAAMLRSHGFIVFSPAEKDEEVHGEDFSHGNPTGSELVATMDKGFSIRVALAADLKYICEEADAVYLLPGWQNSRGALAERATALALGLEVHEL